jgi:hypothetical protein
MNERRTPETMPATPKPITMSATRPTRSRPAGSSRTFAVSVCCFALEFPPLPSPLASWMAATATTIPVTARTSAPIRLNTRVRFLLRQV